MTLCIKIDGTWTTLSYGETVTNAEGIAASYETVQSWPAETQEAFGVFAPAAPGDPPAGKVEASRTLKPGGARPEWNVTYADAPVPSVPDNPTLGDWRVGLTLWGRMDDVTARVAALMSSSVPAQAVMGKVARERLEYSNNVQRSQLLQLKDLFGFSEADVDESLERADRVRQGDLSGVWPLPA